MQVIVQLGHFTGIDVLKAYVLEPQATHDKVLGRLLILWILRKKHLVRVQRSHMFFLLARAAVGQGFIDLVIFHEVFPGLAAFVHQRSGHKLLLLMVCKKVVHSLVKDDSLQVFCPVEAPIVDDSFVRFALHFTHNCDVCIVHEHNVV